jgi:hypothetical protein
MEFSFKIITKIAIAALVISTPLHVLLITSDNWEYRNWVIVQIALQLIGAGLLVRAHNYKTLALIIVLALSVPFAYINARFINYNNSAVHLILFIAFWAIYGFVIYGVRNKFAKPN